MKPIKHLDTTIMVAGALGLFSSTANAANNSIWAGRTGMILPNDHTVWCSVGGEEVNGVYTATASMEEVNTDGSLVSNTNPPKVYTDSSTTITLRMQCMDSGGNIGKAVTGAPSKVGTGTATVACPVTKPATPQLGVYVRCMMSTSNVYPFVYDGNQGGNPCASAASKITASGTSSFVGQITGHTAIMEYDALNNKLFNASSMSDGQVGATDMGYMFYASGKLWAGYGDTWTTSAMNDTNKRGSVLFSTTDLSAATGLYYTDYIGSAQHYASEIIPSCHNGGGTCDEQTAIASAGFGLNDGGTEYHFLWFDSIKTMTLPPYTSNDSTLAWSKAGGAFVRGDKGAVGPTGSPPKWGPASNFATGAIWQDRMNGYIYFFGTKFYVSGSPIELARVPAKVASVLDGSQYQYWDSTLNNWVSSEASATPIVQGNLNPLPLNPGPEFSVAFDAYSNTYLMMLVANRLGLGTNSQTPSMEVWQAPYVTGPWTQVPSTGLPSSATFPEGSVLLQPYDFFYAPFMNEQIMGGGGSTVYYQLSEWIGVSGLGPYNVGLWNFNVTPNAVSGCQ